MHVYAIINIIGGKGMIWVVNSDTTTCHIYYYKKKPPKLELLQEIKHPEIKLKKSEYFTSDKSGCYKGRGLGSGGSFSQRTDPKEVEIDNFAREIARALNDDRKTNAYKKLIIIMPPHMNGLLFLHLDQHVRKLVANNIQKDYQHLSPQELLRFLQSEVKYPDNK
jgi:protein required for attachment to host cells